MCSVCSSSGRKEPGSAEKSTRKFAGKLASKFGIGKSKRLSDTGNVFTPSDSAGQPRSCIAVVAWQSSPADLCYRQTLVYARCGVHRARYLLAKACADYPDDVPTQVDTPTVPLRPQVTYLLFFLAQPSCRCSKLKFAIC